MIFKKEKRDIGRFIITIITLAILKKEFIFTIKIHKDHCPIWPLIFF